MVDTYKIGSTKYVTLTNLRFFFTFFSNLTHKVTNLLSLIPNQKKITLGVCPAELEPLGWAAAEAVTTPTGSIARFPIQVSGTAPRGTAPHP